MSDSCRELARDMSEDWRLSSVPPELVVSRELTELWRLSSGPPHDEHWEEWEGVFFRMDLVPGGAGREDCRRNRRSGFILSL